MCDMQCFHWWNKDNYMFERERKEKKRGGGGGAGGEEKKIMALEQDMGLLVYFSMPHSISINTTTVQSDL